MDVQAVEMSGKFLAEQVDKLFIDGFGFSPESEYLEKAMSHFICIENVVYMTFFKEKEWVLKFTVTGIGIQVDIRHPLLTRIWGLMIKDEYFNPQQGQQLFKKGK